MGIAVAQLNAILALTLVVVVFIVDHFVVALAIREEAFELLLDGLALGDQVGGQRAGFGLSTTSVWGVVLRCSRSHQ